MTAFHLSRGILFLKAGTFIYEEGTLHSYNQDTPVSVPELVSGSAYQVYATNSGALVAQRDEVAPTGYAATRMIGGFHTESHAPTIRPASPWDIVDGPARNITEMAALEAQTSASRAADSASAAATGAADAAASAMSAAASKSAATTSATNAADSAASATASASEASAGKAAAATASAKAGEAA